MDRNKKQTTTRLYYISKHKEAQTYGAIKKLKKKWGVLADLAWTNEFTFGITQPHCTLLWKHAI